MRIPTQAEIMAFAASRLISEQIVQAILERAETAEDAVRLSECPKNSEREAIMTRAWALVTDEDELFWNGRYTRPQEGELVQKEVTETMESLRMALGVAVSLIMENEPGDSRAVSDIAVALALVSCDMPDNKTSWDIIAAVNEEMAKKAKSE